MFFFLVAPRLSIEAFEDSRKREAMALSLSLLPYPPPVPFISIVRFSRFSRECRERASTVRRREGAGGGSSRERVEEAFGQRGTEEVKPTPEKKSKRGRDTKFKTIKFEKELGLFFS